MKNQILKLFLCMATAHLFISVPALAQENLSVDTSPDASTLSKINRKIGEDLITTCASKMAAEDARQVKATGANEQDMIDHFKNENEKKYIRDCICKNKSEIRRNISDASLILTKNPKWKGKTLVTKSTPPENISTDFSEIETALNQCE